MNKLKLFVTIIPCLLITIIGIIQNTSILKLTLNLIITIILFYSIGYLIEIYIKKKVFSYDNIDDKETLTTEDENEDKN